MEFLIFFGAGMFLLGAVYVILGILQRRKIQGRKRNWLTASAHVVRAYVGRREYTEDVVKYDPVVTYTYEVDEQTYTRTQFGNFPRGESAKESQAICDRFAENTDLEIHYNPDNPQQSILVFQKPRLANYPGLIAGLCLLLAGSLNIALGVLLI